MLVHFSETQRRAHFPDNNLATSAPVFRRTLRPLWPVVVDQCGRASLAEFHPHSMAFADAVAFRKKVKLFLDGRRHRRGNLTTDEPGVRAEARSRTCSLADLALRSAALHPAVAPLIGQDTIEP